MERDCDNCKYFYECDNMGWYEEDQCRKEIEDEEDAWEDELNKYYYDTRL